jgi:hypothetical protein
MAETDLGAQDVVIAEHLSASAQPRVTEDGSGGAWIAWIGGGTTGSAAVIVQHLFGGATWAALGSRPVAVGEAEPLAKSKPRLVADGDGGAFLAWLSGRYAPRAVHLLPEGAVDPGWPIEGLHLEDPAIGSYQLEAVSDGSRGAIIAWERARDTPSINDLVMLQKLSTWGTTSSTADTSLVLTGCIPNPSKGIAEVALELRSTGPAILELFDAMGRRVATRDVGVLGPGSHVVRLSADRGALAPGVYLLCLRSKSALVSKRAIVVP